MQSHNAEYIAEAVSGVIDEVKQECGKMPIALVKDNASNMKKSWKLLGKKYSELTCYGCAAHSMNLIFGDLMKLETLKKVKHQAKQIAKEFKSEHMLVDLLKSMQKVERVNVTLKLPVKTRWGSVVTCLESVQKNKVVLRKLAVSEISEKSTLAKEVKKTILDDDFWNVNEAVVNLLKPLFSAITQLEADVPNLAEVYKLYSNVRCNIRDNLQSVSFSLQEQEKIATIFAEREKFCIKIIYKAAYFLDPRESAMKKKLQRSNLYAALLKLFPLVSY